MKAIWEWLKRAQAGIVAALAIIASVWAANRIRAQQKAAQQHQNVAHQIEQNSIKERAAIEEAKRHREKADTLIEKAEATKAKARKKAEEHPEDTTASAIANRLNRL